MGTAPLRDVFSLVVFVKATPAETQVEWLDRNATRVTQRGDGLSISVELINAQGNSQIWGRQYNRKLADVFAVQEEIAKKISQKLRLKDVDIIFSASGVLCPQPAS